LALNVGTELVSDFSEKERIRREYFNDPASAPDHNRAAILLGLDILFGRITFVHQWGIYYYAPYPAMNPVYQRYGLNLRFTDRFYLGINIKAHGHVADLMDVRLGIQF
ncbi:MAG: acyloxyacyl hydrolase, partial [Bacteroidota bacterium]|nr:acyloxyacyl hydrolase [Bacteroidota bacterium]